MPTVRWASRLVAALCVLVVARPAHADTPPNAWDLARDPPARDRWTLHVRVERLLAPPAGDDEGAPNWRRDVELRLEAARAMLEQADAASSPDVRLRFDLGRVYYGLGDRQGGRDDLYQKALAVLVPALDEAPDHPAATEALATLVYAYAKLNRPHDELAAWHRYIPRLADERSRVVAMMNMGEAEMRVGQIDDALGTFREVLRICGELPNTSGISQTYVLGLWDVAIALDRSGDPHGALDAAGKARQMGVMGSGGMLVNGSALIASDPSVFFVPAWEREWYLALDAMAGARDTHDAREAAALWGEADRHWETYVERSSTTGSSDPFLRVARMRREQVHAKRLEAEKAVAKLPKRPERRVPWIDSR
jgi:tetratricopeptide (TPR) repeat protein